MNNIHEYYDNIADVSVATREAVEALELAKKNAQTALSLIKKARQYGSEMTISFVSDVTTNDTHRNLLFFEVLLNQVFGLVQSPSFQELLDLTNYSDSDEEF